MLACRNISLGVRHLAPSSFPKRNQYGVSDTHGSECRFVAMSHWVSHPARSPPPKNSDPNRATREASSPRRKTPRKSPEAARAADRGRAPQDARSPKSPTQKCQAHQPPQHPKNCNCQSPVRWRPGVRGASISPRESEGSRRRTKMTKGQSGAKAPDRNRGPARPGPPPCRTSQELNPRQANTQKANKPSGSSGRSSPACRVEFPSVKHPPSPHSQPPKTHPLPCLARKRAHRTAPLHCLIRKRILIQQSRFLAFASRVFHVWSPPCRPA